MYFWTRVAADRPINADVPERDERPEPAPGPDPAAATPSSPDSGDNVTGPAAGSSGSTASAPRRRARRRRPRIPGALLLIGGLVVLAIGFIVLAVVAGSGGGPGDDSTVSGPAPAPVAVPEQAGGEGGEAEAPAAETSEGLGYPAFATDNTTRVGGATAAENAAAVALAVFPSTTAAQRPAAVALVAEDDWPTAVAAAVLMAPPVRVPLLFSGPDSTPEASEEALAALDPQGSKRTNGARGFAFGAAVVPEDASGFETIRMSSEDEGDPLSMVLQIAELRDQLFGSPPVAMLVAPLDDPAFAMPAAAWAARSGDPVLFSSADSISEPTAAALQRHPDVPVYVLGPPAAISERAVDQIAAINPDVKRVSGKDPVKNALAFARYAGDGGFGWNVNDPGHGFVLVRADSPLEAAAAAPLSAAGTWGPLLLTDSAGTLPPEVRSYLLDVKPGYTTNPTRAYYNHVWVIGDQEAIDVKQQAEANELAELAKIGAE